MNPIAPFSLTYSFDYSQFENSDLREQAQNTLTNFLGFVAQTFDGLLENGRALQNLYFECIAHCPDGKKVFQAWLDSDFGASKYIADSAMSIYAWYEQLPVKVQRLVRKNVQNWSVSALRQLTKVSHDLVKELVCSGKKTAAQVKEKGSEGTRERGRVTAKQGLENDKSQLDSPPSVPHSFSPSLSNSPTSELTQSPTPSLRPGMRIIVKNDDMGWNGHSGIIMSKSEDNFWVLLDHTVAQGMFVKHLLKPHQIQPEVQQSAKKPASKQEYFTNAEVEEKIAQALAQRDREKAESDQGRFIEIRDAAQQAVKC
jgi:hypothetical protein